MNERVSNSLVDGRRKEEEKTTRLSASYLTPKLPTHRRGSSATQNRLEKFEISRHKDAAGNVRNRATPQERNVTRTAPSRARVGFVASCDPRAMCDATALE